VQWLGHPTVILSQTEVMDGPDAIGGKEYLLLAKLHYDRPERF
jgi:hypothetical protein